MSAYLHTAKGVAPGQCCISLCICASGMLAYCMNVARPCCTFPVSSHALPQLSRMAWSCR